MSISVRRPEYYDEFCCLGGACPDSCCKEWDVQVDEAAAAFYRQLPGELGDSLRRVLKDVDGETLMQTQNGRCPMWREDGLCRIQAALGEEALCQTCRSFPRIRHDYGDFAELGLELSCPEAARLILSRQACFVSGSEAGQGDADYDENVMALLLESREQLRRILRDESYTVGERFAIALLFAYHVQGIIDGETEPTELFDPQHALEQGRDFALKADAGELLEFFSDLEILSPLWTAQLAAASGDVWRNEHILLAEYFMDRYWLQAVSDLDLVCRAKFMLVSCLTVKLLGGDVSVTAQRYSKEIENNIDNVEAAFDAAYTCRAFADNRLLGLMLD